MLYIAATNRVVSVVVVVEREENGKTVQRPVYYLSEVISASKQNYPHYQKMTYGLYMAVSRSIQLLPGASNYRGMLSSYLGDFG